MLTLYNEIIGHKISVLIRNCIERIDYSSDYNFQNFLIIANPFSENCKKDSSLKIKQIALRERNKAHHLNSEDLTSYEHI
jgi:hypothetical protein